MLCFGVLAFWDGGRAHHELLMCNLGCFVPACIWCQRTPGEKPHFVPTRVEVPAVYQYLYDWVGLKLESGRCRNAGVVQLTHCLAEWQLAAMSLAAHKSWVPRADPVAGVHFDCAHRMQQALPIIWRNADAAKELRAYMRACKYCKESGISTERHVSTPLHPPTADPVKCHQQRPSARSQPLLCLQQT